MQYFKKQRGFTLIETLMVLAIFIVILGALTASVGYFYRSNTQVLQQSIAVNSVRKGVEGMVKDIREATFSDEGAYPVIAIGTSTISFYADIDSDIFIERVRYYLDGTDLMKAVTNSSGDPLTYSDLTETVSTTSNQVINTSESVDIFTYYNSSGNVITDMASTTDVRFVAVKMIVNVSTPRLPSTITLRSSATLRNLRN